MPHWLVPHFEKMLYDNALLAHAYLEAFRATGNDRYARVARETLDFMLAELRTADGGFASALDADSEGVEGRFYVWSFDAFMTALADAGIDGARSLRRSPHIGGSPPTAAGRGRTSCTGRPGRRRFPTISSSAVARLCCAAAKRRVRPARDDKQLAAWNGLALRAFALRRACFGRAALLRGNQRGWSSSSRAT